jgi:hypothetical protein
MLGDAARTLLGDPDRLALFVGLVGWLTIDNVRTYLFRNITVGLGALAVLLDLVVVHDELLAECLGAAAGVFVVMLIVELVWDAPLGMGTVKASALIALFLGSMSAVAVVIGGAIGLAVWFVRKRRGEWDDRQLPAGPGMLAAAVLTLVLAQL